jgi:hypothetical protein
MHSVALGLTAHCGGGPGGGVRTNTTLAPVAVRDLRTVGHRLDDQLIPVTIRLMTAWMNSRCLSFRFHRRRPGQSPSSHLTTG